MTQDVLVWRFRGHDRARVVVKSDGRVYQRWPGRDDFDIGLLPGIDPEDEATVVRAIDQHVAAVERNRYAVIEGEPA